MDILKTSVGSIYIARSLVEKTRGVIGREQIFDLGMFFIPECNWVHGFFVSSPIYIYFFDQHFNSLSSPFYLTPFTFSPLVFKARHVLETKLRLSESEFETVVSVLQKNM